MRNRLKAFSFLVVVWVVCCSAAIAQDYGCNIVAPADSDTSLKVAITDLQTTLNHMTGGEFSVVTAQKHN